jgi:8-oxo-dGTP pyrophosphatase MutT (NUDIX family)
MDRGAASPGGSDGVDRLDPVSSTRGSTLELTSQSEEIIHAAGGIPLRRTRDGWWEVVLVHRPARADWSFPKGKLEPGESFEDCAQREVTEETGYECRLGRFIGHTEYRDRKDRRKVVAYWVMEVTGGEFAVNEEVDEIRWLDLRAAVDLLSYTRDRELLSVLVGADEEGGPFG